MLKGSRVKIKPLNTICEYLHNLKGTVVKIKTESIWKRIDGGDPRIVGKKRVCTVDLSENNILERGKEWKISSKRFQIDEQDLDLI